MLNANGMLRRNHSSKSYMGGTMAPKSPVLTKLAALEGKLMQQEEGATKPPWIRTSKADTIFGIVVLLNAAFIGVDLEVGGDFNWYLWAAESTFLVLFLIEIALRVLAEKPKYYRFFDAWGIFDTGVTIMGIVDTWIFTLIGQLGGSGQSNPLNSFTVLRVFRLVRLVRLIRVIRMFSELVILVQTIGQSIKAVAWMSLLLGMIIYTGSIFTVMLVGVPYRDDDPEVMTHFGSLGNALFSHFCVVTTENWPGIAMAAINHNSWWAIYFVFMIILTNFMLVNLMVGVIVERIINASMEQENALASFVAESEQFRKTLQAMFDSADLDASGAISRKEIRQLLDDPRTHEIMSAFGINLNIPLGTLQTIMDVNCDGDTTFEEFYHACMRLCGSKSSIHSVFVQADICSVHQEVTTRMERLEERLAAIPRSPLLRTAPPIDAPLGNGAGGGSPSPATASPSSGHETALLELLERMERFGQVQQHIYAEIHALKEHAHMQRESPYGGALPPSLGESIAEAGPVLLQRAGQELGACCIDSLFSNRRGVTARETARPVVVDANGTGVAPVAGARGDQLWPPPSTSRSVGPGAAPVAKSADTSDLRAAARRELEAEFRSKRVAGSGR